MGFFLFYITSYNDLIYPKRLTAKCVFIYFSYYLHLCLILTFYSVYICVCSFKALRISNYDIVTGFGGRVPTIESIIPFEENGYLSEDNNVRNLSEINYSPAFRSADGRSEREGMLSSTTSQIDIQWFRMVKQTVEEQSDKCLVLQIEPPISDCHEPVYNRVISSIGGGNPIYYSQVDNKIFLEKNEDNEYHCPICSDTFDEKSTILLLPCKHVLCKNCLESYLKNKINDIVCPFCRTKII